MRWFYIFITGISLYGSQYPEYPCWWVRDNGYCSNSHFFTDRPFNSPITESLIILVAGSGVLTATQSQDRPVQIMGAFVFTFASVVAVLSSVIELTSGTLMIMLAFCFLAVVFLALAYMLNLEETPRL